MLFFLFSLSLDVVRNACTLVTRRLSPVFFLHFIPTVLKRKGREVALSVHVAAAADIAYSLLANLICSVSAMLHVTTKVSESALFSSHLTTAVAAAAAPTLAKCLRVHAHFMIVTCRQSYASLYYDAHRWTTITIVTHICCVRPIDVIMNDACVQWLKM